MVKASINLRNILDISETKQQVNSFVLFLNSLQNLKLSEVYSFEIFRSVLRQHYASYGLTWDWNPPNLHCRYCRVVKQTLHIFLCKFMSCRPSEFFFKHLHREWVNHLLRISTLDTYRELIFMADMQIYVQVLPTRSGCQISTLTRYNNRTNLNVKYIKIKAINLRQPTFFLTPASLRSEKRNQQKDAW